MFLDPLTNICNFKNQHPLYYCFKFNPFQNGKSMPEVTTVSNFFFIRKPTLKKKWCRIYIFIQKLPVNFTNSYKAVASNMLN